MEEGKLFQGSEFVRAGSGPCLLISEGVSQDVQMRSL